MSVYGEQIIPKQSLIVVLHKFEPDIYYQKTRIKSMDFNIWSAAPYELLEIYYCFPSFFVTGVTKAIKDFKIDGNTVILQSTDSKTFNHPWTILPEMILGFTENLDPAQRLYAQNRMQFIIDITNESESDFTENSYWYLIIRATTAQQFKVSVNMLG